MGLNPQTIGQSMPNGFAGCYARQPDMIVNTRPAGGSAAIPFGTPLKYSSGAVVAMGASDTADLFVGIAGAEIKSALTYLDQYQGEYAVGEPVSVFQRGCINVYCQHGTPALGQPVYLRITANGSYSSAVVEDWSRARMMTLESLSNCPTASGQVLQMQMASQKCEL